MMNLTLPLGPANLGILMNLLCSNWQAITEQQVLNQKLFIWLYLKMIQSKDNLIFSAKEKQGWGA
jgi:hypothetical protein